MEPNCLCEMNVRLTQEEYAAVCREARLKNVHLTSIVREAVLTSVGLPFRPLRNIRAKSERVSRPAKVSLRSPRR